MKKRQKTCQDPAFGSHSSWYTRFQEIWNELPTKKVLQGTITVLSCDSEVKEGEVKGVIN
jgi:hypothetical protein